MRCRVRGSTSSWNLFLLLHAPNQFKNFHSLETIIEETNEVNSIGAETESEHRCQGLKSTEFEDKTLTESKESTVVEQNTTIEQKEKSRKQWQTSPDQMKEISRSLSQINGTNLEKKDHQLVRSKRTTNEKLSESKANNRSTLPPISTFSDSDSGKEQPNSCICQSMYRANSDSRIMDKQNYTTDSQWIVTRPKRNKPRDTLRLEGPMELQTTFSTTYDSTAKQINDNLSKNVAIVMPSSKVCSDENNFERIKQSKSNESFIAIKSSKKKPKHRPTTSLKAGGVGYFNTINKESYKNFVIIDENSKIVKTKSNTNGKKSSVCCSTVANIKLPKVDNNNRDDKHITGSRKTSKENISTEMKQINRSMNNMSTEDNQSSHLMNKTEGKSNTLVESSDETNKNIKQNNIKHLESKAEKNERNVDKSCDNKNLRQELQQKTPFESNVANSSWTVGNLEEHKRVFTRDVDNIKELGILDEPNEQTVKSQQIDGKDYKQTVKQNKMNSCTENINGSTRVRIESKHYVQTQRRQKKHNLKNESSMRLFQGDMDFTTTTNTCFSDKSPIRGGNNSKQMETNGVREKTAGKRSRKSGRRGNLFRTSTEANFYEAYTEKTVETTYQKQFGDRLYCPVIDLGSNKSEFKYRGESSGHKFFLPAVKY